jgi:sigma-B regulation protein RsbU (phosphoserine phosphatase)
MPVGIFAALKCDEESVVLESGDVLLVFSDGVLEAGIERGEEFGESGLLAAAQAAPKGDIEAALDYIANEVLRFSPGLQSDDVTIVALSVH